MRKLKLNMKLHASLHENLNVFIARKRNCLRMCVVEYVYHNSTISRLYW